jgi:dTMP kinase
MRGKFITVEGIEGSGKTTQLALMREYLEWGGFRVVTTREPGGTEFGEEVRKLALERRWGLDGETEALLMFAARKEHVARVIKPALECGSWVLCDRFTDSTYAYQCGGRGVPYERLKAIEGEVLQPDLTLLFDLTVMTGRARASARDAKHNTYDRIGAEDVEFFTRVRHSFLVLADHYPERIKKVDARYEIDKVRSKVRSIVEEFLKGFVAETMRATRDGLVIEP